MIKVKRNKPLFFRQGWDRYMRLGKTQKKRRKWRAAKGGDSKTRLKENGRPIRPTIGWGAAKSEKHKLQGFTVVRVETMKDFAKATDKKTHAVMIARVGEKKRIELTKKAEELGLKILNTYWSAKK